jgi:cytochrome c peroxidase
MLIGPAAGPSWHLERARNRCTAPHLLAQASIMSPSPSDRTHGPTAWALAAVTIAALLVSGPVTPHAVPGHHTDSGHGVHEAQNRRDIEPPTVLAPGYADLGFEAPAPGSYWLPPIQPAADAEVLLATGDNVRLHEVFGDDRLVFLSFIYTVCPDVHGCPLASFVLQRIHRKLQQTPDLAGRIRLVSLSFDPETDSPEVMREYARQFDAQDSDDWIFLTGESMEALQPLLDAYGQGVARIHDEQGRYTGHVAHVLRVYLIDTRKRIRNIYNVSFLHPDILLADARTLLMEDEPQPRIEVAVQDPAGAPPQLLLTRAMQPPLGLPPIAEALRSRLTSERVDLGQRLFFDRRLSSNRTLACASCHIPSQGFTQNAMARSIGMEGQALRRNASSLLNAAHHQRLYWDGREFGIDTLVWGKLLDEPVMGNRAVGEVMARLRDDERLLAAFDQAFPGDGLTMRTLAEALTDYVSTLVAADSRFDRWHFGQKHDALSEEEQRGYRLFVGRAGCAQCHALDADHALFTDHRLHNTGIGYSHSMGKRPPRTTIPVGDGTLAINLSALRGTEERRYNDLGRYEITQDPADRWKFRTPTLRNVALTAPYMHDGSIATLEGVVTYYNEGGTPHELQAPQIRPLGLNADEQAELAAFLRALTDPALEHADWGRVPWAERASDLPHGPADFATGGR